MLFRMHMGFAAISNDSRDEIEFEKSSPPVRSQSILRYPQYDKYIDNISIRESVRMKRPMNSCRTLFFPLDSFVQCIPFWDSKLLLRISSPGDYSLLKSAFTL